MIPGELFIVEGDIELNAGRSTVTLTVANTGDRPIQVGSHYHFYETNPALSFNREQARGCRLDIPAGTAVRFEPGQTREVQVNGEYHGRPLGVGYRADLIVESILLVEVKSVSALNAAHVAQALSNLRLGGFRLGLLLNFSAPLMKQGIQRVINTH